MRYLLMCADPDQKSMFYSDYDPTLRNACVGYSRMDFGSGNEFRSTWCGKRRT